MGASCLERWTGIHYKLRFSTGPDGICCGTAVALQRIIRMAAGIGLQVIKKTLCEACAGLKVDQHVKL